MPNPPIAGSAIESETALRGNPLHESQLSAAGITPEFIEEYAAVGSPEQVLERLVGLRELGLDKVVINGNWRSARGGSGAAARQLIETEVLPALRA